MFITSAPSRLPAISNDDWVRVEASKNRLIWVRPRRVARFFSTWREIATASSASSSSASISGARQVLDAEQVALGEDGGRHGAQALGSEAEFGKRRRIARAPEETIERFGE